MYQLMYQLIYASALDPLSAAPLLSTRISALLLAARDNMFTSQFVDYVYFIRGWITLKALVTIVQALFCVAWATNCLSNSKNCSSNSSLCCSSNRLSGDFLVFKGDWTITDWVSGSGGNVWELHEKKLHDTFLVT